LDKIIENILYYIYMEDYVVYNSNISIVSTPLLTVIKDLLDTIIPTDIIIYISFFLPKNIKYKIYNLKYKPNRKQKYYIKDKVCSRYRV
tara:strand:+ start:347 stop:613 length:267 start_codon:yes stop_codon:yes gene_type:complete